eukprot:scaffold3169_cov107-Cylindrotheca_fusiformis.AAC.4
MASLQMPTTASETPLSVDEIIASELDRLSLKEREKVYEDVHGVSDLIHETPELISSCLEQMDREIDLINEKDAYEQARLQSQGYVTDRLFRLSFLRSTSFNPQEAAHRLVKHVRYKLETFGAEKLTKRSITLNDIGDESVQLIRRGCIQILPNRDSQGRVVLLSAPRFLESFFAESVDPFAIAIKAYWYLLSTLAEDEESQKKGIVTVSYSMDMPPQREEGRKKMFWGATVVAQSLPLRLACLHFCYNSSRIGPFLPVVAVAFRSVIRARIRIHQGSHSECQYKLMSFGIPIQEFPVTLDGGLQLANHEKWMEKRKKKEEYLEKNPPINGAVDLPSKHDVLLGRGKPFYSHIGNRTLQELVENYYARYNKLEQYAKTRLAEDIVAVVHGYFGRFLKHDTESGMWVEVSNVEARDKVTHSFRRKRHLHRKATKTVRTTGGEVNPTNTEFLDGGGKRLRMLRCFNFSHDFECCNVSTFPFQAEVHDLS